MNAVTTQQQLVWTPYLRPAPLAAEAALRVISVGELDAATLALVIGADPALTAALVRASEPADMNASISDRIASLPPARLHSALFPPLVEAFASGVSPFTDSDAAAWRTAVATAIAAECIAEESGAAQPDAAYLAGLLRHCARAPQRRGETDARNGGALRTFARRYRFPAWLVEAIERPETGNDMTGRLAGLDRVLALATAMAEDTICGGAVSEATLDIARRSNFDLVSIRTAHDRTAQSFARRMSLFAFSPADPTELQASLTRSSNHALLYWRVDEMRATALLARTGHLDALLRFERLAAGPQPLDELLLACADGMRAALSAGTGMVVAWTDDASPVTGVRWGSARCALEPFRLDDAGSAGRRTIQHLLGSAAWPDSADHACPPCVLPVHSPSRRHIGFIVIALAAGDEARHEHAREWAAALGGAVERLVEIEREDACRDALYETVRALREQSGNGAEGSEDDSAVRRRNVARAAMAALHAPLSAVTTQAHRLVSRSADPETQELVEALAKDARNAARVVTDLQAIAGGVGAPNEFVLINAPLRQFLHAARPRLERRSIRLTERFAEGLPRIRAGARPLHHLFTNLFAFIERRMGHAGRAVAVTTAHDADRAAVLVNIDVTGMALTQTQAETLFDPLASRESASTETALALAACRAVVDECGGTIAATTTDSGVSFAIAFNAMHAVLAVERAPEREDRGVAVFPPEDTAPLEAGPGECVLIVDDDDTMRDLMKQALLRRAYRVETAKDGNEALRALDGGGAGIVLLDLLMPNRDGLAVLRELQRRPGAPPAIVMTGSRGDDVRSEAIALGARGFLQKPFELGQLLAEVESLLVHRR